MMRRLFLKAVIGTLAALAGSVVLPKLKTVFAHDERLGAIDNDEQMATLLAFGETLLPASIFFERNELAQEIDGQALRMAAVRGHYRAAANLLDETALLRAGRLFRELPLADRQAIVTAIMPSVSPDQLTGRLYNKVLISPRRRLFADVALRRMNQAVYRTSMGWRIVHYGHHIGGPAADPLEYTQPPKAL